MRQFPSIIHHMRLPSSNLCGLLLRKLRILGDAEFHLMGEPTVQRLLVLVRFQTSTPQIVNVPLLQEMDQQTQFVLSIGKFLIVHQ
jgi:hypothetical protein